jgi:catalase
MAARRSSRPKAPDPTDTQAPARGPVWAQGGDALTTSFGTPVEETDNSLKVGGRGPTLLEDFHLREKVMHFDHERIPERVVHARGAGAYGRFQVYESLADLTCADVFSDPSRETPTFVRFSTVVGSRGSMDTPRDVRGFAVRWYTAEGNLDIVGNNIPVFFIQDGIKFPDVIHAVKPEVHREIPQAASAHDTFWDFSSLASETTHMLMWVMSDRAIPRSFRTMQGFGVHTFRFVNEAGGTALVKFHWKPMAGVHSLVWEESQKVGGVDPDFHRRDLWDAIESGAYPEYELGIQVMPDNESQTFEGIDLLDPTKIVPEELCPVRPIGRMVLDRNPDNFFAEVEQVAFHTGHLVRGIDITDDPLLHARNFSYLDTQLFRLGGPNFDQLPVNRPHAAVNTTQRDGFGQHAIHQGRAPYLPNSLGGGCPVSMGAGGYVHVPRQVDGPKVRERGHGDADAGRLISFDDHYTQARQFWLSMSVPEQDHIVSAFSFELGKVDTPEVVERQLQNLAEVDEDLARRVAEHLGQPVPKRSGVVTRIDVEPSPALSQMPREPGPITGRLVAMLADHGVDATGIDSLGEALEAEKARMAVIAPHKGPLSGSKRGTEAAATKSFLDSQSVEFDGVVVAGGRSAETLAAEPLVGLFIQEAFRHHKTIAAWGTGTAMLDQLGIDAGQPGVVTATRASASFSRAVITALGWHRHWFRPRGPAAT